jgi:hypothetical protein
VTDCAQIRDTFTASVPLPEAQLKEHLANCLQCRELFERDAELGRRLAEHTTAALPFADDLFGQLEQRLVRETGPRAWLRSRPSGLRFTLVLLPLLLVLLVVGVFQHRADFGQYPNLRVGLLLCVYFLAIVLAFGKQLSELPRSDALRDYWALLAFALAVPILAAFAPATLVSRHAESGGALGCFGYGALLTLPIAALIWALDRDDRPSLRTVCLSAA